MDFFIKLLVAGGIMGVIDLVWLSFVANKFYKSQIGSLLLEKPNMGAAALFYVIYVVGVVVFVLSSSAREKFMAACCCVRRVIWIRRLRHL
jgi:uncharacterized membrane protein